MSLIEILEAIYFFRNDASRFFKHTYNHADALFTLSLNSNKYELEYILKLIYQMCFEDLFLKSNPKLNFELYRSIILDETPHKNLNLVNKLKTFSEGILRKSGQIQAKKDDNEEEVEREEANYVFISLDIMEYGYVARLKTFLEKYGLFRVWYMNFKKKYYYDESLKWLS